MGGRGTCCRLLSPSTLISFHLPSIMKLVQAARPPLHPPPHPTPHTSMNRRPRTRQAHPPPWMWTTRPRFPARASPLASP